MFFVSTRCILQSSKLHRNDNDDDDDEGLEKPLFLV